MASYLQQATSPSVDHRSLKPLFYYHSIFNRNEFIELEFETLPRNCRNSELFFSLFFPKKGTIDFARNSSNFNNPYFMKISNYKNAAKRFRNFESCLSVNNIFISN